MHLNSFTLIVCLLFVRTKYSDTDSRRSNSSPVEYQNQSAVDKNDKYPDGEYNTTYTQLDSTTRDTLSTYDTIQNTSTNTV